jgi:ACS family hexuronate transporter-like MFS transporter
MAFVLTGAIGLVWASLWLCFYHSPDKHPKLSSEERDYIVSGQEKHLQGDGTRPSIQSILRRRNFWGLPCPGSWRIRRGALLRSGFRYT